MLPQIGETKLPLPKFSREINFGQLIQFIAIVAAALWFTFGIISDRDKRIEQVSTEAKDRENVMRQQFMSQLSEQKTKIELLENRASFQDHSNSLWQTDIKTKLKELGDKLDTQNQTLTRQLDIQSKTLTQIQLGLANKVDRKP